MILPIAETEHLRNFPSSSSEIRPERLLKTDDVAA